LSGTGTSPLRGKMEVMSKEDDAIIAVTLEWGTLSVLHAMCLKARDEGAPFRSPAAINAASSKAFQTAHWHWKETLAKQGITNAERIESFTEIILDWTWNHRKGSKNNLGKSI
jgi:hypothetical protein